MNDASDPEDRDSPEDELARAMSEAERAVDAVRGVARAGSDQGGESDDEVEPSEEEGPDLAAELEALRAEVATTKDRWLRAVADHENYKKRVKREMDEATVRAISSLLEDFLPVGDDLDRAMAVAGSDPKLLEGLQMVSSRLSAALSKHGIVPIEALGHPFDPALHDALQQVDSPDHPPGMVTLVFEKGYRRGDRLLRPARVIVAGAGSTGTAPEDEGADAPEGN